MNAPPNIVTENCDKVMDVLWAVLNSGIDIGTKNLTGEERQFAEFDAVKGATLALWQILAEEDTGVVFVDKEALLG